MLVESHNHQWKNLFLTIFCVCLGFMVGRMARNQEEEDDTLHVV